jgi:2-keto-4-pentenoate hydratase
MGQGGEGRGHQGRLLSLAEIQAMESAQVHRLAGALVQARRSGQPIAAADWRGAISDAAQAYEVQDQVAHAMGWGGAASARYWKSGGASRQVTLTHAALAPAGVRESPADLRDMSFFNRAFEAEIALRLGRTVTPERAAELTPEDAHGLVDAMAVSIELVDSRWLEGGRADALLRLADAQSHGALVLGEWRPYERRDWAAQTCVVDIVSEGRGGARADAGAASESRQIKATGSHSMGDPAWLLPIWLRHGTRHGQSVARGSVVTTGTWVGLVPARTGELVSVEFAGMGSAVVQL